MEKMAEKQQEDSSGNIFKNAKFGDCFKTRDGRKVLYHSYNNIYPDNPYEYHHNLILEKPYEDSLWIYCNDYGHTEEHINGEWLNVNNSDIVSEWEEPISGVCTINFSDSITVRCTDDTYNKVIRNKGLYNQLLDVFSKIKDINC